MLRDKNGSLNFCPFTRNNDGSFVLCAVEKCAAYDVIPAEYTADRKPTERCLMMISPFYPAPCCGPVTEFKDEVEVTLYKENEENG